MVVWKFVFVFVCGNIVVFKFVEMMLLMVFKFVEIVCDVGLFEGVVNIVMGVGEIGVVFVQYKGVDKVVFIGLIEVGCQI